MSAGLCAAAEVLDYRVDWKLWHAGDIRLVYETAESPGEPSTARVSLKTQGVVDDLYGVDNHYEVKYLDGYCADSYVFEVKQGKNRRHITTDYRTPSGRASYTDRDLVGDRIASRKLIRVPDCVHDELTALARFRAMDLGPGESVELPVSNGKKFVSARIVRQKTDTLETPAGEFDAVRYEVFLFDNVLYKRKGRLFVWLTADERRLPVKIQVRLGLYGTVTLSLVEKGKL